jgi:hypothetical protein
MKTKPLAALFAAFFLGSIAATAFAQPSPPPGGGPPPEAYDACIGKAKGDACTVELGDRPMKGTCESPPPNAKDTRLSCRPSEMPPRR